MPSSGMLRRVAFVRIEVLEERRASIISVLRINIIVFLRSVHRLLVTANVVPTTPIPVTLMMEELLS
jgi:hypothetical protein